MKRPLVSCCCLLLLLLIGCGGSPKRSDPGTATSTAGQSSADFRCKVVQPDGTCVTYPANCPVTIPHPDTPRCGAGAQLIPKDQDDCGHELLCVD
jgi:hypothetical protein